MAKPVVARGMGPMPVRIGLAGLAFVYYVMLLKHPEPAGRIVGPIAYLSECTGLFTQADVVASEYRVEGWSCERRRWEPLDPRPYFPMRADDKEARFQRLAHFYKRTKKVMEALDDYIVDHHAGADDGIAGPLGGIQLFQIARPIPEAGGDVERYTYEPLAPVPAGASRIDLFFASTRRRHARCGPSNASKLTAPVSAPEPAEPVGSASDPWEQP